MPSPLIGLCFQAVSNVVVVFQILGSVGVGWVGWGRQLACKHGPPKKGSWTFGLQPLCTCIFNLNFHFLYNQQKQCGF